MINIEIYKKLTALAHRHIYSSSRVRYEVQGMLSDYLLSDVDKSIDSSFQFVTT